MPTCEQNILCYDLLMKTRLIEFGTNIKFISTPSPAKRYIPEWYKKASPYFMGVDSVVPKGTVKTCIPFLDSIISGYTIELSQDVHITVSPDKEYCRLDWGVGDVEVAELRSIESLAGFPIPSDYYHQSFAWKFPYSFRTPVGYSTLISHPFNRLDLPFTTLSGIVDSDGIVNKGNLPFFVKKNFTGIIPAGTPIAQLLPFKREGWTAKNNPALIEEGERINFLSRSRKAFYKRNLWHRKSYD